MKDISKIRGMGQGPSKLGYLFGNDSPQDFASLFSDMIPPHVKSYPSISKH